MKGRRMQEEAWRFSEMKKKIEEIERLVLDLKELGQGMPVIEKNACSIQSFIYVLKFGVSDVVEITDRERRY